jgi:hypothetical protein
MMRSQQVLLYHVPHNLSIQCIVLQIPLNSIIVCICIHIDLAVTEIFSSERFGVLRRAKFDSVIGCVISINH